MKSLKYISTLLLAFLVYGSMAYAQQSRDLQYFRAPDKTGLNIFEAPKTTDTEFDRLKVRIGGSNTLQFQALTHDNDAGNLPGLTSNFNLATSNLDFDVALANGLRMHLRTYLSSQNHPEAWVKGGYMQIDRLDFIQEGFMEELMDNLRIKVGHMEINYGDNHFRRSDNGAAIHNPFVGNYIMDSFTTEVGAEVYYFADAFFGMVGFTNGKLNQSTVEAEINTNISLIGKLGYDNQINDDTRFRLTGSVYSTGQSPSIYLYTGDRAGSRYYNVMDGGFRSGRFAPQFNPGFGQDPAAGEMTAIMINPFVKYQGIEFYGVYEIVNGKMESESDSRTYNQYGAELLYRFGNNENLYLGGRYNVVTGEQPNGDEIDISRINLGGGWFMTNNVLAKLEYVTQKYDGFSGGNLQGGEFSGIMLEAVISF